MLGLTHLLSPLSVDDFLQTYKGKRAAYIEGSKDKFQGLYDWEDVNHVINKSRLHSTSALCHLHRRGA